MRYRAGRHEEVRLLLLLLGNETTHENLCGNAVELAVGPTDTDAGALSAEAVLRIVEAMEWGSGLKCAEAVWGRRIVV